MSNFTEDLSVVIGAAIKGDNNLKLPFFISDETGNADIEALGLSPRAYNSLKRNKVATIFEVANIFSNLDTLRNVGGVSKKEIRQKVADYLYDAMTMADRKAFWREFITLNNIEGLSASKGR